MGEEWRRFVWVIWSCHWPCPSISTWLWLKIVNHMCWLALISTVNQHNLYAVPINSITSHNPCKQQGGEGQMKKQGSRDRDFNSNPTNNYTGISASPQMQQNFVTYCKSTNLKLPCDIHNWFSKDHNRNLKEWRCSINNLRATDMNWKPLDHRLSDASALPTLVAHCCFPGRGILYLFLPLLQRSPAVNNRWANPGKDWATAWWLLGTIV